MTYENVRPPSIRWNVNAKAWPESDFDQERRLVASLSDTAEDRELLVGNVDTLEAIHRVTHGRPAGAFRSDAALVVRCDDCGGRSIAWVVWTAGRPLFIGDRGGGKASVALLDVAPFARPTFRCRKVRWSFSWPLSDVPGQGARRAEVRVEHRAGDTLS